MRIGFVTSSISRKAGGLHESVRRLAQSMHSGASTACVYGLQDEHTADDIQKWAPLEAITFPVTGMRSFGYAPGLARSLVQSSCEILSSHGLWMYPSVAVSRWHSRAGGLYVVHPHGMLDPWAVRNSRWRKRVAGALYEHTHLREAACIRALCQSEAESIRAYGLKNPIAVIPNGIDLPRDVTPQAKGVLEPLKSQGTKVLLFLSRIHPKKGLENLIRAWACIEKTCLRIEWTLAIAGWDQGGHEAELKTLATGLGLSWSDLRDGKTALPTTDSLVFLGPQFGEAKAACYRSCDAFILPSFSEGLPMVVLEAWAHGKPVLMTPQCNLPEGFEFSAAFSVNPDAKAIATGLLSLLSCSEAELCTVGGRGRDLVVNRFSWLEIGKQMEEVYLWVLGCGSKPDCVQA